MIRQNCTAGQGSGCLCYGKLRVGGQHKTRTATRTKYRSAVGDRLARFWPAACSATATAVRLHCKGSRARRADDPRTADLRAPGRGVSRCDFQCAGQRGFQPFVTQVVDEFEIVKIAAFGDTCNTNTDGPAQRYPLFFEDGGIAARGYHWRRHKAATPTQIYRPS